MLLGSHVESAEKASLIAHVAGRRAIAVPLVRVRGPLANKTLVVGNVYVPSGGSPRVKAAFIEAVGGYLRQLLSQGVSYVCPGDWNASFGKEWRASPSPDGLHDERLAEWFGEDGAAGR